VVLVDAGAELVHRAQVVLSLGQPLLGRHPVPSNGFDRVRRAIPRTLVVTQAEVVLRLGVSALRQADQRRDVRLGLDDPDGTEHRRTKQGNTEAQQQDHGSYQRLILQHPAKRIKLLLVSTKRMRTSVASKTDPGQLERRATAQTAASTRRQPAGWPAR
jgi:hypothetical protein